MAPVNFPVVRPEDLRVAIDLMALGYRREVVIRWLRGRRGALTSVRENLMRKAIPAPLGPWKQWRTRGK